MPSASYSVRRVYWPSQETVSDFFPTAINTAGSFDLATDGEIVCGKAARGQTLICTTTDLWTMTYIGGDLIYAFARVGNNCGIISQHALVVLDTAAYWMGTGKFFVFDGFVKTVPCDVNDSVFSNLNAAAASTIWALANPLFSEITWYYPSNAASLPDRYVTYNYLEEHWTFGALARTTGVTRQAGSATGVPVLIDSAGHIYDHETGNARGGSAGVFLESGPAQMDEGDNVMRIQRIVPDDKTLGDVTMSLYTSMYPDAAETLNGPYTLSNPTSIRLTARQVRIRIVEAVATSWRFGVARLGAIVSGRR